MSFKIENTRNMVKSTNDNGQKDTETLKREAKARGEYIVSISGNEKGLFAIAKKFNMTLTDFKNMTGLTKDTLQKGQVIKNIPTAKIESGMGLYSLAKKYGMTLKEFTELNGIKENYKPQKGEYFYVYPSKNQNNKPAKTTPIPETTPPKPTPNTDPEKKVKEDTTPQAKQTLNAEEIADKLEQAADKYRGAVGKEEFDSVFKQIDKDNVIDVVNNFQKKQSKSLINMISDEWSSNKDARKSAMTKIFDLVAEKTGNKNPKLREEFIDELNDEFDSWGFVSTKKMDKIINSMKNPIDDTNNDINKKDSAPKRTGLS